MTVAGAQGEVLDSLPDDMSAFGSPEQVHPVSPGVLVTLWLVALACLGPAGMAFYFLWQPFGSNPPPREVMAIGGSAFVAGSLLLIGMALWVRSLTYLVFHDALVQVRGGRNTIFRWDEIDETFEEPAGVGRYRIDVAGRKKSIASIVKNHRELGETIVVRVTERLLPVALRIFEKGGPVPFGPLSVSPDLLTYKNKQLAWSQLGRMEIKFNPQLKSTQLEIRLDGQFQPWCSVAVRTIPNFRVFLELVRRACPTCPSA